MKRSAALLWVIPIAFIAALLSVIFFYDGDNQPVESPPAGICKIFDNDGNLVDIDTPVFTNDAVSCMHGTYQSVNPRPMGE